MFDGVLLLSASGYFLAAVLHSLLAVNLYGERRSRFVLGWSKTAMAIAVVSTAGWGWVAAATQYEDTKLLMYFQVGLDLLRYAAWLVFLLWLLRPGSAAHWRRLKLSLGALTFVSVVLAIGSLGVLDSGVITSNVYARVALYSGLALPLLGLVMVEQLFHNVGDEYRWHVKPLCLALGCVFVFDVYMNSQALLFGRFAPETINARGTVHALAVPFLVIAVKRQSGWTNRLQVSRTAAFHSATLMLGGLYLLSVSAVSYYVRNVGGQWGAVLQTGLLFAAVISLTVLALSGTVRARVRVFVGKHFFRYQYDYRKEWLDFTAMLSVKGSPEEMGQLAVRALANMVESAGGGLWLRTSEGTAFGQTARYNTALAVETEAVNSRFAMFLITTGWIIVIDQYKAEPQRYPDLTVPGWLLASPNNWLIVPLLVVDDLLGFVVLTKARTDIDVNWEVTDLLKTASRQAAAFLSQMQTTEALLEARKFDAFNRMSAFVVHDLKNIVTQLSLMMQNAKRLKGNPEFQQDMLMTVENSLDKMRQLMLQLRDGQSAAAGHSGVNLGPVVRRIESTASGRGRTIDVNVVDDVIARGDEKRIERVLGHIVQNAVDATPPSGRVWLKLQRVSGQIEVEVGDTGHGMSAEFVREQLFKPFHTTKEAGMGIGAYESYRYVRELGGNIVVNSEVGSGTTVTITLPLFEMSKQSDLHMQSST